MPEFLCVWNLDMAFKRPTTQLIISVVRGMRDLKNVIRLVPPMTTPKEQIDSAMSIIYDALRFVVKGKQRRKVGVRG